MTATTELRQWLAELVAQVLDGQLSPDEAERAGSLAEAGIGSLEALRIIDAVEREFGVTLRLDADLANLDSIAGLAQLVEQSSSGHAQRSV